MVLTRSAMIAVMLIVLTFDIVRHHCIVSKFCILNYSCLVPDMIVAKGSLLENAKNGCKLAATFGKSLQELQRKFGSWQPAASLHWDAPLSLSLTGEMEHFLCLHHLSRCQRWFDLQLDVLLWLLSSIRGHQAVLSTKQCRPNLKLDKKKCSKE